MTLSESAPACSTTNKTWGQMPVTEPSRAVFLSYASQDVEAAQRICETLRAAGIEVWFDQSELRGGDAWDRQIRKQIHDCVLFVPVISANTQARLEGYFRREWKTRRRPHTRHGGRQTLSGSGSRGRHERPGS